VKVLESKGSRAGFQRIGLWGWLSLYASGAVLLFFLLMHVCIVHFATPAPLGLSTTIRSLDSLFVRIVEIGLLVFVLVHGLIGLRRIVLDFEFLRKRGDRFLVWSLVFVGVILLAWGLILFTKLVSTTSPDRLPNESLALHYALTCISM
jgi:succinate dehydrogenase hydrophobic anchor subunit